MEEARSLHGLNGILAGLVGITAGADTMGFESAVFVGAAAGSLVVFAVSLFDGIRIDDPVGAISVHLVCGVWGTLAVGLVGEQAGLRQFGIQLVGVLSYALASGGMALGIFAALKKWKGIRVSQEEEVMGLDLGEHGCHAYADFVVADGL